MEKLIISILFSLLYLAVLGQTDSLLSECITKPDTLQGKEVLVIAEQMPQFPGGAIELRKFIANNIIYPDVAEEEFQCRIFATFVIDTSGCCVNECIVRPMYKHRHSPLEVCLLDVIRSLPRWEPMHRGQKVPIRMTLPINISLSR